MARDLTQDDLAELKINIAKFRANGDKYFGLFDKHIPAGLPADSEILLYKIGNLTAIVRIIEKNPAAAYCVYDRECVCTGIRALKPDANVQAAFADGPDKYDIFENREMKFDLIIMNPPYGRTLPHSILSSARIHLKNQNSTIISLQPVTQYQTFIEATTISEQNMPYIKDIGIISAEEASKIFGVTVRSILGIIQMDTNIHNYKYQLNDCKSIYDKIINKKLKSWRTICSREIKSEYFLCMNGDNGYAKGWHMKPTEIFNCQAVVKLFFSSEEEKQNFYNTVDITWLYNFIYILDDCAAVPGHFPWLGDAVNPRTGLKGYLGPWTDEDLYEYFGITAEERKIIEDTVAKYK